MFHPQRKTMDLLPLVCLCLLTWSAGTAADHSPVVVKVEPGSDVILPCSLSPQKSITSEHFEWKKDGQKKVFEYDGGDHSNTILTGQDEQFRRRVSHFSDQLKNGNASIMIINTQLNDTGNYTCDFPDLQPRQTFYIKLVFGGAAPEPSVTTLDKTDDGVVLQCAVKGASPQPEVEWKDSAGNILPAKEPQVTEKGGSYDVILQATVTKTDRYRCVVTQEELHHQIYVETYAGPLQGAAPEPSITTLDFSKDWALLQCAVRGVSPQPKVEWKDSAGNILPAKEPQVTDRGGSYDVVLQATVTKTDRYRCVVTQDNIHQIYTETYAGPLNDSTGLVVGVSVPIILLVVGFVLVQTEL